MDHGTQPPMVDRHQARADEVVAMARRHAEEIRTAAEREAERVVAEAEREAMRRHEERLEADRRERTRIGVQRQHIEDCLDATAAAVTRMRELIASLPVLESSQPASEDGPSPAPQSNRESANWRGRVIKGLTAVLGVWAVVMTATLAVVARKPADAVVTENTRTAEVSHPDVVPTQADRSTVRAAAIAPVARIDVAPVRAADEHAGLTVAFVAARDCWISIASDDEAPSERMLKASERYVVRARDAISFKAGNAAALSVLINELPAGPLGAEGQVVARRITRANYRSFLQS
jgi:vacuolar-type H+-ATPase subunit H